LGGRERVGGHLLPRQHDEDAQRGAERRRRHERRRLLAELPLRRDGAGRGRDVYARVVLTRLWGGLPPSRRGGMDGGVIVGSGRGAPFDGPGRAGVIVGSGRGAPFDGPPALRTITSPSPASAPPSFLIVSEPPYEVAP